MDTARDQFTCFISNNNNYTIQTAVEDISCTQEYTKCNIKHKVLPMLLGAAGVLTELLVL